MEPYPMMIISRDSEKNNVSKERCPGDGMEAYTLNNHIQQLSTSKYKLPKSTYRKHVKSHQTVDNLTIDTNRVNTKESFIENTSFRTPENTLSTSCNQNEETFVRTHQDMLVTIDSLKTQLKLYEDHNNQLIEEKMRLSQQLGVQTQVNNEIKKLLVASIGEDMQQKYERLIQDKAHSDLELKHLHNVMQEDREEVEQAMIQADVWRSKFLASRVMSDELARWKSALYYKYRESHTALQSLLEEHSKIRALNNATRRGLISVAELLGCKDPSLDSQESLTTIDVAFINHDLAEALVEIITEDKEKTPDEYQPHMIEIKHSVMEKEKGKTSMRNDIIVEADELTPAEQLAHEVVINTGIQTEELTRMRHDYLAHNRISHFLSTNYHVTFNCCEQCKGPVQIV